MKSTSLLSLLLLGFCLSCADDTQFQGGRRGRLVNRNSSGLDGGESDQFGDSGDAMGGPNGSGPNGSGPNGSNGGPNGSNGNNPALDGFTTDNDFQGSFGGNNSFDSSGPGNGNNGVDNGWDAGLDGSSGRQKLMLTLEPEQSPPVDYLFVVDNSVSMSKMLPRLQSGFAAIASRGEFPSDAKIGVISTAVDEVANSSAKREGFKSFVRKSGCDNGFFSPTKRASSGKYCLSESTNFGLHKTVFEAGLSAFDNLLEVNKNKALFRRGALVNVIFVSDTHDIGVGRKASGNKAAYDRLSSRLRSYSLEGFLNKARAGSKIATLKFHGIVPKAGRSATCSGGENATHSFAYSKFINASGGKQEHCSTYDYAGFISSMVESSRTGNRIKKLPEGFSGSISEVKVNGVRTDFIHDRGSNSILFKNMKMVSDQAVNIEVITN